MIYFASLTKTDLRHVPYRGLSQAMNDLVAGQIDVPSFDQAVDGDAADPVRNRKDHHGGGRDPNKAAPQRALVTRGRVPAFETTAWSPCSRRRPRRSRSSIASWQRSTKRSRTSTSQKDAGARIRRAAARCSHPAGSRRAGLIRDRPMGSAHQSSGLVRRLIIRHEE